MLIWLSLLILSSTSTRMESIVLRWDSLTTSASSKTTSRHVTPSALTTLTSSCTTRIWAYGTSTFLTRGRSICRDWEKERATTSLRTVPHTLYIIMTMAWVRLIRHMDAKSNMDAMDSTVSYMESMIHRQTTLRSCLIPTRVERFNTYCVIRTLPLLSRATLNKCLWLSSSIWKMSS